MKTAEQVQEIDRAFKRTIEIIQKWNSDEGASTIELKELREHLSTVTNEVAETIAIRIDEESENV